MAASKLRPLSDVYLSGLSVKTQWKIPRGFRSECDGYVDFPLADAQTYISPLTAKVALYTPGMHISLLLNYSGRGFVMIMQKREPVDPHIHSLRTTEKCSHLTEAQGEDRNPRLEHMPRLVPNSPFRRSATRLPSKYRGLSWHSKPAGTPRKKKGCVLRRGVDPASRGGMSC